MNQPRFHIGEPVRVIRAGPRQGGVGVVIEVDSTRLIAHYVVAFDEGFERRFPEFDLAAVRERVDSQVS